MSMTPGDEPGASRGEAGKEGSQNMEGVEDLPPKEMEREWTSAYDQVLDHIAASNSSDQPWHQVRPLLKHKLARVLESTTFPASDTDPVKSAKEIERLLESFHRSIDQFRTFPFTMQRLAELVQSPLAFQKTKLKYIRAVEKMSSVTTTDDIGPSPTAAGSGNLAADDAVLPQSEPGSEATSQTASSQTQLLSPQTQQQLDPEPSEPKAEQEIRERNGRQPEEGSEERKRQRSEEDAKNQANGAQGDGNEGEEEARKRIKIDQSSEDVALAERTLLANGH